MDIISFSKLKPTDNKNKIYIKTIDTTDFNPLESPQLTPIEKNNEDNINDQLSLITSEDTTNLNEPHQSESFDQDGKNMNYNEEEARLSTFDRWSVSFIPKEKLARFGFYHVGPDDTVKCYFCKVEIGQWGFGDNVLREHFRWSPSCPLLRRRQTGNIPIDAEALNRSLPPTSYDVNRDEEIRFVSDANPDAPVFSLDHPDYKLPAVRMATFEEWPKAIKQKPSDLSEAGFFYIGKGDQVKCFSCGGGLKDWEENDDPWEQHALWYNNCPYLNLVKTESYIKSVKEKYENTEESSSEIINEEPKQQIDESEIELEKLCKICYVEERNTAFIPCMHVVSCGKCALALQACPICRRDISDRKRIFFS